MQMQDHDELEQVLERSSAQMIGHSASLIETFMRRLRERAQQELVDEPAGRHAQPVAPSRPSPALEGELIRTGGREVAQVAPGELSDAELKEQMKARHGIDVDRLGDREHDRRWVDNAAPGDVLDLLRAADRDADMAAEAARVRDNLKERIREYGVDPDTLMSSPAAAAGETLREHRASFLDEEQQRGRDGADTDRDAAEVTSLMNQAQTADRDADTLGARSQDGYSAAADRSRSERVQATGSTTPAASAAALAAKDHPTNPRHAAATAVKQAPKAKSAPSRGADRERGHSGR